MGESVGVIGLGQIGLPVARMLMDRGFEVHGYRRSAMADFTAAGGIAEESAAAVARGCRIIISCIPGDEALADVISGPQGIISAGQAGRIVVELSTTSLPSRDRQLAALKAAGSTMLDCPLSGIPKSVEARAAVLFASGAEQDFEAARHVLEGFTDKAFYCGEFGVGSRLKYVANFLVSIHIGAAAEAVALGVKAGLDPELVVRVLAPGPASSFQFTARGPLMAERNYEPIQSATSMLDKGINVIADFMASVGFESAMFGAAAARVRKAVELGYGEVDVAAVFEAAAHDAGIEPPGAPHAGDRNL